MPKSHGSGDLIFILSRDYEYADIQSAKFVILAILVEFIFDVLSLISLSSSTCLSAQGCLYGNTTISQSRGDCLSCDEPECFICNEIAKNKSPAYGMIIFGMITYIIFGFYNVMFVMEFHIPVDDYATKVSSNWLYQSFVKRKVYNSLTRIIGIIDLILSKMFVLIGNILFMRLCGYNTFNILSFTYTMLQVLFYGIVSTGKYEVTDGEVTLNQNICLRSLIYIIELCITGSFTIAFILVIVTVTQDRTYCNESDLDYCRKCWQSY